MARIFDRKPDGYNKLDAASKAYVDQAWAENDRAGARRFVDNQNRERAAREQQMTQVREQREQGEPVPQSDVSREEVGDVNQKAADFLAIGGSGFSGQYQVETESSGEDRGSWPINVELSDDQMQNIADLIQAGDVGAARDMFNTEVMWQWGTDGELRISEGSFPF